MLFILTRQEATQLNRENIFLAQVDGRHGIVPVRVATHLFCKARRGAGGARILYPVNADKTIQDPQKPDASSRCGDPPINVFARKPQATKQSYGIVSLYDEIASLPAAPSARSFGSPL